MPIPTRLSLSIIFLACIGLAPAALAAEEAIDWLAVRELLAARQQGDELSASERELLQRSQVERRRLMAAGEWPPPALRAAREQEDSDRPLVGRAGTGSSRLSLEEAGILRGASVGLVPLTDLGTDTYRDQPGGLYGDGRNQPTPAMRAQEARLLTAIVPRGPDGSPAAPAAGGRIGLVTIGMSNTSQESAAFIDLLAERGDLAPGVVVVDGAQPSADVVAWGSGNVEHPWDQLATKVADAGLTPAQIQAVWLKHALRMPQDYGPMPFHTQAFKAELSLIIHRLARRFPNLRIVHLSSRSYGGYFAERPASPEPYAYEAAFAIRELILDQAAGHPYLDPEPADGRADMPLLRWGPYLWADGETARSDGLRYVRSDFSADGIHPSPAGRRKIAELLAAFYFSDPSAAWFRSDAGE